MAEAKHAHRPAKTRRSLFRCRPLAAHSPLGLRHAGSRDVRENASCSRRCWRIGPVSPKSIMRGMRENGKPHQGWRHFHWTGNHAKPPSNVSARGHGVCMARALVEWTLLDGTHSPNSQACCSAGAHVGDPVYGTPPIYTGHGLHLTCTHLAWTHPTTGHPLTVRVTPAKKMKRALPGTFVPQAPSPYLSVFDAS